jgi:mannose-1-phosphate guanylyltransferase/mannose-6-phosphate isomerase
VAHVRELSEGRDVKIIIEPTARNTAPAIGLAAERLSADKIIMVFPSDHYISDTDAFIDAATTAAVLAQKGWLVAFGIEATAPETGFGYIRRGDSLSDCTYRIAQFVEKPNLASAEKYLADGNYFWNGGIFCFTAGQYLEQLANSRPAMRQAIKESVSDGRDDGELFYPNSVLFSEIIGESIDYAVMEQAKIGAVVPVSMGWSDIGNWHALQEARNNGAEKNLTRGPAELIDCHNVMTDSDGPRVSVIGLEDVIVVVDGGEVLVTTRAGAQKVGQLAGAREQ